MAGSRITWTSSDPAVVTAGRRHHPSGARAGRGDGDADGAGSPRAMRSTTREIAITVPAEFDDAQSVARDTADLALAGLDDIRGNITLPAAGEFGSAITLGGEPERDHADRRGHAARPTGVRTCRSR